MAISDSASPSARRMRIGTIRDENTGASTKRPPMRAKTRKKVATSALKTPLRSTVGFTGSGAAGHLRDLRVQLDGEGQQRVQHPRAGEHQHEPDAEGLRDEAERLLLDLRDRLDDRDGQAD